MSLIGPSYQLYPASVQRTIGMVPVPVEPGNERTAWVFRDIPGLVVFASLGAPIRGVHTINGRTFAVAGSNLFEIDSAGTATNRGAITGLGFVGMDSNGTQLVVSNASLLYALSLATNVLTSVAFPGKARIAYLNQRILFVYRDSQQFGWTSLGDAESISALSFASAESSPDKVVGIIVDHMEVFLFGEVSGEPWQNTASSAIFERNTGGVWEVGAASEFSIQKIDGNTFWLATTETGQGGVYQLSVYQPKRISTAAIEKLFDGLDLSQASAYTYDDGRSVFYCLNVPGLSTTLVYDTFTGQWHERAELVNGLFAKWRPTCHTFAFGKHLVGADDGFIYALDHTVHSNAGDPLLRERTTPITGSGRKRLHPNEFWLDCEMGRGGRVMLRYSPDGGNIWSAWKSRSLGALGKFSKQVRFKRLNSGKAMVVQIRCTDNVPFNPVAGDLA